MNADYMVHSSNPNPVELFQEAQRHFEEIRYLRAKDPIAASEIIQETLVAEMSNVIFASNNIERAGEDLLETMRICQAIFRGEKVEEIDERSVEYQRRLENLISENKGAEPDHIIRSRREVVQHALALQYMTTAILFNDEPWSEEILCRTHRILCTGVNHPKYRTPWRRYGGKYRDIVPEPETGRIGCEVNASGTCFTPFKMVPRAMSSLVKNLNAEIAKAEAKGELDPYHLAAKYCADFVWIHPFLDGNGRMCRLILNTILLKYTGIVVSIGEHDEEREEYLNIKRRLTAEAWGPGEFAAFVVGKATLRLKSMRDNLQYRAVNGQ